jgi:transposase InsO family protein
VPAAMFHPIIKPWPFHSWGLNFIGQIHPHLSRDIALCWLLQIISLSDYFKGHRFIGQIHPHLSKNMIHKEVIEFITEHIIHRFGILQTLTTDQGILFMSKEVRDFAELYKIKLLKSSPYYAQANGQAESSNKTLIKLIKKKIKENPRRWHEVLSKALWAHRISRQGAIKS